MHPTEPLILASASPRRKALLSQLGVPFSILVSGVSEHEDPATDPVVMVNHNAKIKAEWVAARHAKHFVLGADTTVCIDGCSLNKPTDLEDAKRMLRQLSGKGHSVFTGLALLSKKANYQDFATVETKVFFRNLSESDISRYVAVVNVLDKAGAYAIQDHGDLIVERFEGSHSNVVGLPLETTKQMLVKAGLLGA